MSLPDCCPNELGDFHSSIFPEIQPWPSKVTNPETCALPVQSLSLSATPRHDHNPESMFSFLCFKKQNFIVLCFTQKTVHTSFEGKSLLGFNVFIVLGRYVFCLTPNRGHHLRKKFCSIDSHHIPSPPSLTQPLTDFLTLTCFSGHWCKCSCMVCAVSGVNPHLPSMLTPNDPPSSLRYLQASSPLLSFLFPRNPLSPD